VGKEAFGFQDDAPVDVVLGTDADRSQGRPGQGARRVTERLGVVADVPGAGEVAFDCAAKALERLRVLAGQGAYRSGLVGQPQQEHTERALEDGVADGGRCACDGGFVGEVVQGPVQGRDVVAGGMQVAEALHLSGGRAHSQALSVTA
jgi:hypothetical protein